MTPEQFKEMRALILMELELHDVSISKDPWLGLDAVQEELTRSIVPVPHEGRIPSTGAIFVENIEELGRVRVLPLEAGQLELARKLADGSRSFLLFHREQFRGLVFFPEPMGSELRLVRGFPTSGGLILQRNMHGATKLFRSSDIIFHENRAWFTKPHVRDAAQRISHCVPEVDRSVLKRLLEFSFHLLSPASRTGATLVWNLREPEANTLDLNSEQDLRAFNLSLLDERDSVAVCHFLSQIDGATVVDREGKLLGAGVHLKASTQSSELIPEYKGTRHTSARRFSYDNEHTLVFTVSEDGPVTVFSDGASIADLLMYSSKQEARMLKSAVPEKKEDITHRAFEVVCEKCGKTSLVEEVKVVGSGELKTVQCLICQHTLITSLCFALECRPIKRIALNSTG
jgi:DNA integrity scanning protein DisA with diadenylate cyclase activity